MDEYKLNDIADELLIVNRITIEKLFQLENCADCVALYMLYYRLAKWQKTNTVKANDTYVKKVLKWGKDKTQKTKETLKENGLINIVQRRKDGKICGWYVEVKYLVSEKKKEDFKVKVENMSSTLEEEDSSKNPSNQQVANPTSSNQDTVALKANNSCLKSEKKLLVSGNTIDYQGIADMYNEICVSFPRLRKLSEQRKKAIRARLKTYSLEDFKELFEMAEKSDFLKGKNKNNWSATFDWLIADANMAKVLDGNYKNKEEKEKEDDLGDWADAQTYYGRILGKC